MGAQPGRPSVHLHTSYINGVVSFVVDLFPASRASVSILKGIPEALATKDVATLCGDDETSVLHNLEKTKGTASTQTGQEELLQVRTRAPWVSRAVRAHGTTPRGSGQKEGATQLRCMPRARVRWQTWPRPDCRSARWGEALPQQPGQGARLTSE